MPSERAHILRPARTILVSRSTERRDAALGRKSRLQVVLLHSSFNNREMWTPGQRIFHVLRTLIGTRRRGMPTCRCRSEHNKCERVGPTRSSHRLVCCVIIVLPSSLISKYTIDADCPDGNTIVKARSKLDRAGHHSACLKVGKQWVFRRETFVLPYGQCGLLEGFSEAERLAVMYRSPSRWIC